MNDYFARVRALVCLMAWFAGSLVFGAGLLVLSLFKQDSVR